MKLAKNFKKAGAFIFPALVAVAAIAEHFIQVFPPETFGVYGVEVVALVAATTALIRAVKQKSVSGD